MRQTTNNTLRWVCGSLFYVLLIIVEIQCTDLQTAAVQGETASSGATADPTDGGYGSSGSSGSSDSSGSSSSSGSSDSSSGSSDSGAPGQRTGSIFEGPISLPIPVAKLDAVNPERVVVTQDADSVTFTGQAGAADTSIESVWAFDSIAEVQKTVSINSDGSFDAITFELTASNADTTIALAVHNGTNIGTPIFLRLGDTLVWHLTNGTTIGAMTMDHGTVYVVSEQTSASSLTKALTKGATATDGAITSYVYALDIGGVSTTVATGALSIDQVFVDESHVMVRSGNSFYYPDSSKNLTLCCSVDSEETITYIKSDYDWRKGHMVGVATDEAFYLCSQGTSQCEVFHTLTSGESYHSVIFYHKSGAEGTFVRVFYNTPNQYNYHAIEGVEFDLDGNQQDSMQFGGLQDDFAIVSTQDYNNAIGVYGTGPVMSLYINNYGEGRSGTSFPVTAPDITYLPSSSTAVVGSETANSFVVHWTSDYNFFDDDDVVYSLDAAFTFKMSDPMTLVEVEKTRTIHHVEVHPAAKIAFFCANDDVGRGQLYAFCPKLVDQSSLPTDGSEIIQLTDGDEHCDENKQWKVDIVSSSDSNMVIVDTVDSFAQARWIDPETQPELVACW